MFMALVLIGQVDFGKKIPALHRITTAQLSHSIDPMAHVS